MFDAAEAATGISRTTNQYYNGDLFLNLRSLVSSRGIAIDKLILVFNKIDLLADRLGGNPRYKEIVQRCVAEFASVLDPLYSACNPEKICEVGTTLTREGMEEKNQGAPIVKGEAARTFVTVMAGQKAADALFPEEKVTQYEASYV